MHKVTQDARAHQHAGDRSATVDRFTSVGDHTRKGKQSRRIAHGSAVKTEVAPVTQFAQHRLRECADPTLQSAAVVYESGNAPPDLALGLAVRSGRRIERRTRGVHAVADLLGAELNAAMSPGSAVVDLDHDASGGRQRRGQIFARHRQAVAAVFIRRRHLQHQHIHTIVARPDVENAGAGQLAIASSAAVRDEGHAVAMLRGQRVRPGGADEGSEAPNAMALRHQRPCQRHGFGRALAPHDGVACAHDGAQVRVIGVELFHACACPGQVATITDAKSVMW